MINNKQPSSESPNPYTKVALAFDIGLKRTGLAVGQTLTQTAQAVGQLDAKNGQLNWNELDKQLEKWQPDLIIVGDPRTNDPHLKKLINRFKSHIQKTYKRPIIDINEELSSASANSELNNENFSLEKKIELRDQVAACLILKSYFNSLNCSATNDN